MRKLEEKVTGNLFLTWLFGALAGCLAASVTIIFELFIF